MAPSSSPSSARIRHSMQRRQTSSHCVARAGKVCENLGPCEQSSCHVGALGSLANRVVAFAAGSLA